MGCNLLQEAYVKQQHFVIILALVSTNLCAPALGLGKIGVDYGLNGDNLLSYKQTVALLRSKGISRVRIYEAKQEMTQAFANSGIELLIGIPNELVPKIAGNLVEAINWVTQNVAQFPSSGISAVIVGNEWLLDSSQDPTLLLPAMLNIYTALTTSQILNLDLSNIKVSTSHALNILGKSFPPSAAAFQGGLLSVLKPLIDFLEQTGSFFMVNVFPYFAYIEDSNVSLEFALFESTKPVQDPNTKLNYTNLFDLQLDAVYAALGSRWGLKGKQLYGADEEARQDRRSSRYYQSRRVVVGESGWPSGPGPSGSSGPHATMMGDMLGGSSPPPPPSSSSSSSSSSTPSSTTMAPVSLNGAYYDDKLKKKKKRSSPSPLLSSLASNYTCRGRECTATAVEYARVYNQNLVRHVLRSSGTPANPTTPIEAYIFEIFDENLKTPGPEQHYGLFYPNGSPVYPINFH